MTNDALKTAHRVFPPVEKLSTEELQRTVKNAQSCGNVLLWTPREKDAKRELDRRAIVNAEEGVGP